MIGARTETVEGTRAMLHLDTGTWYWRVVALDGGGVTGKHGPARRLTIDIDAAQAEDGEARMDTGEPPRGGAR